MFYTQSTAKAGPYNTTTTTTTTNNNNDNNNNNNNNNKSTYTAQNLVRQDYSMRSHTSTHTKQTPAHTSKLYTITTLT